METKTIMIEATTIYEADSVLREIAFKNKAFPVGVSKTNEQGVYIGEYTKSLDNLLQL